MPILVDGDITTGFLRRRALLAYILGVKAMADTKSNVKVIPEPVYKYAKRISEVTGLPLEQVLASQPVKNMLEKWTKYVVVST